MRMTLKAKLAGLFLLVAILVLTGTIYLIETTNSLVASIQSATRTGEQMSGESRHLLERLREMESTHQDYLLTGNEGRLARFRQATSEFRDTLDVLSRRFARDSAILIDIERIEHLQNKWLGTTAEPEIEVRKRVVQREQIQTQLESHLSQVAPGLEESMFSKLQQIEADLDESDERGLRLPVAELLSIIQRTLSGQRAFILSGDDRLLSDYYRGSAEFRRTASKLKERLSGDPSNVNRLDDLVRQFQSWIDSSVQPAIDLRIRYERIPQTMQSLQALVQSNETEGSLPQIYAVVTRISTLVEERVRLRFESAEMEVARSRLTSLLFIGLGFLAMITLAGFIGRPVFQSFVGLAKGAEEVGRGNLDHQVAPRTDDELGALVRAFNEMTNKLKESTVSREYVERILQSMTSSVIVADLNSRIVSSNRAAQELFGYQEDELLGRPLETILGGRLADDPRVEDWIRKLAEPGSGVQSTETVARAQDGASIPTVLSGIRMLDSAGTPEGVVLTVEDLRERMAAESQRISLEEKELLLREIHHRVKNNMQIISSLLNLGSDPKNPVHEEAIRASQNRIRALALIHEKLYRSENVARIDFKDYMESLASDLFRSYNIDPGKISLTVETLDVVLEMDSAIPCGLVISELISNALKHAFPDGDRGEIRISFQELLPNEYELTVQDNGVGMKVASNLEDPKSMGLRLVKDLAVHQLGGTIDCRSQPERGTIFNMKFKGLSYKPRFAAHV